ncbi:MAG: UxaA family hydrolase [Oscillospiraceae bacterium]
MTFMGYKRPYGKVGVRNHVVVMPGVVCSTVAAERIVNCAKGSVLLTNPFGCGQCQQETERSLKILSGLLSNPNVWGVLIVGLGCEAIQEEKYRAAIEAKSPGKPVYYITIQKEGGLARTVARGTDIVQKMLGEAEAVERVECDISELLLGLECGGSDPTSGASANVVLGKVSDKLIDLGGAAVISETSEFIGGEHIVKKRGATPEIGQAIHDAVVEKDKAFFAYGEDVRDSNPSPGNIRGGLTTLEEKSLGCIKKSGTRPFTGCYAYGDQINEKGVAFMDTAAYDPISTVAEIAAGAQVVVFTTGLGNPMGCAVAPVIKVTGNHHTYEWLNDLLDFDTSASLRGEKTVDEIGEELFGLITEVCNGKRVRAELNGADVMVIDQRYMGA